MSAARRLGWGPGWMGLTLRRISVGRLATDSDLLSAALLFLHGGG